MARKREYKNIIIFLGNIFKNKYSNSKYFSIASNEWQKNFLKNFKNKIINLTYYPETFFPIGSLFVNKKNFSIFKNTKYLNFLNLIYYRNISIEKKIIQEACKLKSKRNQLILMTYNFQDPIINASATLKKKYNLKWINICADFNENQRIKIFKKIAPADLNIFLSYHAYKNYLGRNKLYFYGNLKKIYKPKVKENTYKIIYSGSLGDWTGIKIFLKEFLSMNNNFTLEITSNDNPNEILDYIDNKKVKFHGFLKKNKLNKLLTDADFFLNLRNNYDINNLNNFPSKILTYLQYNKPIISSNLKNIDKQMKQVLLMDEKDDFKKLLNQINKFDNSKINKIKKKIFNFNLKLEKDSKVKIKRIRNLIGKI